MSSVAILYFINSTARRKFSKNNKIKRWCIRYELVCKNKRDYVKIKGDNIMQDDFAQKNRRRPITITEIAIDKVPQTHIFGFDTMQNQYIQSLHKLALKEAKQLNERCLTNEMEVGILVDIHSWDYTVIRGRRPCEVNIKNEAEALKMLLQSRKNQLMFIHNHPSTGTFSGEDFKTFCMNKSLYIMSVVGNDGSVYLLIKNYDFDAERALLEYVRFAKEYYDKGYIRNNGTLAIKDILKHASNYGIIYKKGRKGL